MKLFQMMKTAHVLNTFFSNVISRLNIPMLVANDPIFDNISDSLNKLIVKNRKDPSILTIPVDTGRKLNVYKTFRRHPGRLTLVLIRLLLTRNFHQFY